MARPAVRLPNEKEKVWKREPTRKTEEARTREYRRDMASAQKEACKEPFAKKFKGISHSPI